ncbi:MAG: hypothetical protein Q9171_002922 [Xanthocarpia ochracea]
MLELLNALHVLKNAPLKENPYVGCLVESVMSRVLQSKKSTIIADLLWDVGFEDCSKEVLLLHGNVSEPIESKWHQGLNYLFLARYAIQKSRDTVYQPAIDFSSGAEANIPILISSITIACGRLETHKLKLALELGLRLLVCKIHGGMEPLSVLAAYPDRLYGVDFAQLPSLIIQLKASPSFKQITMQNWDRFNEVQLQYREAWTLDCILPNSPGKKYQFINHFSEQGRPGQQQEDLRDDQTSPTELQYPEGWMLDCILPNSPGKTYQFVNHFSEQWRPGQQQEALRDDKTSPPSSECEAKADATSDFEACDTKITFEDDGPTPKRRRPVGDKKRQQCVTGYVRGVNSDQQGAASSDSRTLDGEAATNRTPSIKACNRTAVYGDYQPSIASVGNGSEKVIQDIDSDADRDALPDLEGNGQQMNPMAGNQGNAPVDTPFSDDTIFMYNVADARSLCLYDLAYPVCSFPAYDSVPPNFQH